MLDRARFPGASAYLERLPEGLLSYPTMRVRCLVFEHIGRQWPGLATASPEGPLRALLRGEFDSNAWIPEVVGQLANLMARDAHLSCDQAYFDWTYETSLAAFNKPLIRQLMKLMSPSLLVLGAAKRWSTLHDGTALSASPVRMSDERSEVTGTLTFPEGLFPPLYLEGLRSAFRAAVARARGRGIDVALSVRTENRAEYLVSWQSG